VRADAKPLASSAILAFRSPVCSLFATRHPVITPLTLLLYHLASPIPDAQEEHLGMSFDAVYSLCGAFLLLVALIVHYAT
jgi:hypothetical protein